MRVVCCFDCTFFDFDHFTFEFVDVFHVCLFIIFV